MCIFNPTLREQMDVKSKWTFGVQSPAEWHKRPWLFVCLFLFSFVGFVFLQLKRKLSSWRRYPVSTCILYTEIHTHICLPQHHTHHTIIHIFSFPCLPPHTHRNAKRGKTALTICELTEGGKKRSQDSLAFSVFNPSHW